MRECLSHAEYTGKDFDIAQLVSKGRTSTQAISAELSGSFQRWEMQILSLQKYSDDLEREFTLLKQHLSQTPAKTESETPQVPTLDADTFTTDEHRSFLDRCLRSIRGDS